MVKVFSLIFLSKYKERKLIIDLFIGVPLWAAQPSKLNFPVPLAAPYPPNHTQKNILLLFIF